MGKCESESPAFKSEDNLVAAVQQIFAAFRAKNVLSREEREILVELRIRLNAMTVLDEQTFDVDKYKTKRTDEIEKRLSFVHEKVMGRELDETMIWDSGHEEAMDYLKAVDEACVLVEKLESLCSSKNDEERELLNKAYNVIQTAMARLEEEFKQLMVHNRQKFEPEHTSFRSSEGDGVDEGSVSLEDDPIEDSPHRVSVEFVVDLIDPNVISDLKNIANLMFLSKYGNECSQAYVSVRKDAINKCLFTLEVEKLSIEDVLKMDWDNLDAKIKRWLWAMKIFVHVYLMSERRLSDEVFGEFRSIGSVCFVESSKDSVLQLLNFGDAVAVGPRSPEKLSRILDMYELLEELNPDLDSLFSDPVGNSVRFESHKVLKRLGDAVKGTFLEFKNAIARDLSTNPFAGGGVHHLTRYVMNYIMLLTDYSDTLNLILEDIEREETPSLSSNSSPSLDEDTKTESSYGNVMPMTSHFRSIASILEENLHEKSKLYKDVSLQQFFLMNNIHYMADKVKRSELRDIFGDEWIRKHNGKFQQHEMNYERATWSSILSLLKDDGTQNYSNSYFKNVIKERFRSFYASFEEVYKNQTGWLVLDSQLREDLRISTSLKVIQAYRTFVGRYASEISDKYIKYSADDLGNYILDLFDGSPKSLHNSYRK